MKKILIIITVIILSFTFFYSCTIPKEETNDSSIEMPEPDPEPDPYYITPDKPENIRVDEKNHEMITIAWDPVYNAKYYTVYCDDDGYQWPLEDYDIIDRFVRTTSFTVTLLQSNTTYSFEVYSWNYAGDSYDSARTRSTTDEAYGEVTFWPLWPIYPDDYESCACYVDGWEVGFCSYWWGSSTCTRNVLTGYRELKLFGQSAPDERRESGIIIYLTTDGYVWNNRYDYDWKNY